jgi:hypothetical protein
MALMTRRSIKITKSNEPTAPLHVVEDDHGVADAVVNQGDVSACCVSRIYCVMFTAYCVLCISYLLDSAYLLYTS